MPAEHPEIPGLTPGERVIGSWPAQRVEVGTSSQRRGVLVLTNLRSLFLVRAGLLGGRRIVEQPVFAAALQDLNAANPNRSYLRIGYGDRMEIPGLVLAGHGFQLDRETPSRNVLLHIASARVARLMELGEPVPPVACSACGAWGSEPAPRCSSCGTPYPAPSLA
jgi:hypothetical protein